MSHVKLTSSLKSLITARHSHSTPLPLPPSQALKSLFSSCLEKGQNNGVGKDAFLTMGTAAIMSMNCPPALSELWKFAGEKFGKKLEQNVENAAIIREVGLKCISFNGIPRTINGLGAFRASLPEDITSHLSTTSERIPTPENIESVTARSHQLWDSIYAPHHVKLLSRLSESHPDLPTHILNSHYGALLADPPSLTSQPGSHKIGRVLTSIIAITCLRAQGGVGPQVTSHVFGLLKAKDEVGEKREDGEERVQGEAWLVGENGKGAEWVLESTDEFVKVLGAGSTSFAPVGSGKRESKL